MSGDPLGLTTCRCGVLPNSARVVRPRASALPSACVAMSRRLTMTVDSGGTTWSVGKWIKLILRGRVLTHSSPSACAATSRQAGCGMTPGGGPHGAIVGASSPGGSTEHCGSCSHSSSSDATEVKRGVLGTRRASSLGDGGVRCPGGDCPGGERRTSSRPSFVGRGRSPFLVVVAAVVAGGVVGRWYGSD